MDLMDYLAVLRRHWLVIAVVTCLGAGVGFAAAKTTEPLYRSTTSTFVSLARGETVAELVQGTTYTQNLVESFTQLATMPAVLDPVIAELDLDVSAKALGRTITAVTPLDTLFVEITATSSDPERAALIADAVAASLARTVATVTPGDEGTRPVVRMTVVADAQVPAAPFTPSTRRDMLLGALVGLPLGVLLALVRALLGSRVRNERGLPPREDRVVLGRVPREPWRTRREHAAPSPDAPVSTAYAQVRRGLQYIGAARSLTSFIVTSSTASEGAPRVALQVASALAHDGRRVLLVEADLRAAHGASGLDRRSGLTSVLLGEASLAESVQTWGSAGLHVLTSGPLPPNPTQLLESAAMTSLLEEARAAYDVVVLQAPPVLTGPDAAALALRTDGAVLVVGATRVRRKHVAEALARLDAARADCLGVIMNLVPRPRVRATTEKPLAAHARTAEPRGDEARSDEPAASRAAALPVAGASSEVTSSGVTDSDAVDPGAGQGADGEVDRGPDGTVAPQVDDADAGDADAAADDADADAGDADAGSSDAQPEPDDRRAGIGGGSRRG
jgi:succinoglycan biosynthesis transport protein ExoP